MHASIASAHPHEEHKSHRAGWLRAAVLGVNDGIVSTSSLMLGVLAANASHNTIITTGIAGLFAGALSMAVGEYVSVSSQRDSEKADIAIETRSLEENPDAELAELTEIYKHRGLDAKLAAQVAEQLHNHNAVVAHARDELGIDHEDMAKPVQAAVTSAVAFSLGSLLPIIAIVLFAHKGSASAIVTIALVGLAVSGAIGAHIGGGSRQRAAWRVLIGGAVAMAITAGIGHVIGTSL